MRWKPQKRPTLLRRYARENNEASHYRINMQAVLFVVAIPYRDRHTGAVLAMMRKPQKMDEPRYEDIAKLLTTVTGAKAEEAGATRVWTFTVPETDLPVPTVMKWSINEAGEILIHAKYPPTPEGLMQQILNRLALAGFVEAD